MRTKLIAALRAAADEVEKCPDAYDWYSMASCNCGLVAKHLTGMEDAARPLIVGRVISLWGGAEHAIIKCKQTGQQLHEVLQKLLDAGLEPVDFPQLEHLGNPRVLDALGVPAHGRLDGENIWFDVEAAEKDVLYKAPYTLRSNFISYARKWADMMEQGVLP